MSTIGSIFHTMRGSGIYEALGQIFGLNAIVHILSGKAIAQATGSLSSRRMLEHQITVTDDIGLYGTL